MDCNIIRFNRALFHVNLLSAPQRREHWKKKKKEVVAKPNSEEKEKNLLPDLINIHMIKLHLSIILSDLSREDNLIKHIAIKHNHLLFEFMMT